MIGCIRCHGPLDGQQKCPMCDREPDPFNLDVFEKAAEVMALWIMRFRVGDPCADGPPDENDKLSAGLLAGSLSAQGLLVSKLPVT